MWEPQLNDNRSNQAEKTSATTGCAVKFALKTTLWEAHLISREKGTLAQQQGEPAKPKPSDAHQLPLPATALCGLKSTIQYNSASTGMEMLPTTYITAVSSSLFIQSVHPSII